MTKTMIGAYCNTWTTNCNMTKTMIAAYCNTWSTNCNMTKTTVGAYCNTWSTNCNMTTRNAAMRRKPGFQRFNQVFMWQEKEMKDGNDELKLLSGNWISIFSNSDLDLHHIHLGSNHKLRLDVSYPYTKFGVNRPKQRKVIEWKLNFYF